MPDETTNQMPLCPCCGKELLRLEIPGQVFQQLAGQAANADPKDVTELFLALTRMMHTPEVGEQLSPEEEADIRQRIRQMN